MTAVCQQEKAAGDIFLPAARIIAYFSLVMPERKIHTFYIISLVLAVWFAATSGVWTYFANLFISLPFGILSFLFYRAAVKKSPNPGMQKLIRTIWIIGIALSLVALFFLK